LQRCTLHHSVILVQPDDGLVKKLKHAAVGYVAKYKMCSTGILIGS